MDKDKLVERVNAALRADDGLALRVLRGHWEELIPIIRKELTLTDEQLRKELNKIFDGCYSKELSTCSEHTIFQRQKAFNQILALLSVKIQDAKNELTFELGAVAREATVKVVEEARKEEYKIGHDDGESYGYLIGSKEARKAEREEIKKELEKYPFSECPTEEEWQAYWKGKGVE